MVVLKSEKKNGGKGPWWYPILVIMKVHVLQRYYTALQTRVHHRHFSWPRRQISQQLF